MNCKRSKTRKTKRKQNKRRGRSLRTRYKKKGGLNLKTLFGKQRALKNKCAAESGYKTLRPGWWNEQNMYNEDFQSYLTCKKEERELLKWQEAAATAQRKAAEERDREAREQAKADGFDSEDEESMKEWWREQIMKARAEAQRKAAEKGRRRDDNIFADYLKNIEPKDNLSRNEQIYAAPLKLYEKQGDHNKKIFNNYDQIWGLHQV